MALKRWRIFTLLMLLVFGLGTFTAVSALATTEKGIEPVYMTPPPRLPWVPIPLRDHFPPRKHFSA